MAPCLHLIFLLLFVLIAPTSFGQGYNVPFRKGDLWGYADLNGNIKIQPVYDSVSPEQEESRWVVFKNRKVGVINETGQEVLPPVFDSIIKKRILCSRYYDYYIVKDGRMGYCDIWGKYILQPEYDAVVFCWRNADMDKYVFLIKSHGYLQLMDNNKNIYLDSINNYKNYFDNMDLLFLSVQHKYGLYNIKKRQAEIAFKYDTAGLLEHKGFYRLKREYKQYKYFAGKSDSLVLFDENFLSKTVAAKTTEDLFEAGLDEETKIFQKVEHLERPFALLNILKLPTKETLYRPEDGAVILDYHPKTKGLTQVWLKKEKSKLGLVFVGSKGTTNTPADFDSIKVMQYDKWEFDEEFLFVCKKGKWGIYQVSSDSLVVPVKYSSIQHSNEYKLFLLYDKKKVAAYMISEYRNEQPSGIIQPFYNDIAAKYRLNPFTVDRYKFLTIYYLRKEGKIYPVGSNGINYYTD